MLEDGLWSTFRFETREDHDEFADLLLMTALKAKKLARSDEEFEIFEEFVFHNTDKLTSTDKKGNTEQEGLSNQKSGPKDATARK